MLQEQGMVGSVRVRNRGAAQRTVAAAARRGKILLAKAVVSPALLEQTPRRDRTNSAATSRNLRRDWSLTDKRFRFASREIHLRTRRVHPMRYVLMATAAASALALSVGFGPAAALSPTGKSADTEGVLHKVQHTERGTDAGRGKAGRQGRDGMRSRDRGPRTEFRSERRDGHRHRHGRPGVDFDFYVGPGYGYVSECDRLRRRAVATGSSYWWRRYRACVNG